MQQGRTGLYWIGQLATTADRGMMSVESMSVESMSVESMSVG